MYNGHGSGKAAHRFLGNPVLGRTTKCALSWVLKSYGSGEKMVQSPRVGAASSPPGPAHSKSGSFVKCKFSSTRAITISEERGVSVFYS